MGTWGYGILDNDTAMDVKGAFEEALEGGLSFDEASYQILAEFKDILTDPDDGPAFSLALAAVQVERGEIPPPPDAQVIDLGGKTVLPGLIDTHVHSTLMDREALPLFNDDDRKVGTGAVQDRIKDRPFPPRPPLRARSQNLRTASIAKVSWSWDRCWPPRPKAGSSAKSARISGRRLSHRCGWKSKPMVTSS